MAEEAAARTHDPELVTRLLKQWQNGDKGAMDQLMPLVYAQLRRLAAGCLSGERQRDTLPATALVHEAYLRLVNCELGFNDRVHFYAVAARILRHILVDHAKAAHRQKRGGGAVKLPLDEAVAVENASSPAILELDEALHSLAQRDQRKSDIIELLFFGGLTYEETAAALKVSPATVHRELSMAKAWIRRELTRA
ncbi:MAG TPA: sigma-70 family RNA polymerase sigma factor [Bryobacteraceae bacterium]|jgi:RNA polymerase sigma factor (TIGR02999 family)|nr:sigma-70 family RNA polymerase sigma factor [Bryobacteraceae bacterium]